MRRRTDRSTPDHCWGRRRHGPPPSRWKAVKKSEDSKVSLRPNCECAGGQGGDRKRSEGQKEAGHSSGPSVMGWILLGQAVASTAGRLSFVPVKIFPGFCDKGQKFKNKKNHSVCLAKR